MVSFFLYPQASWQVLDFLYTGSQALLAYLYSGSLYTKCQWFQENNYYVAYELFTFFLDAFAGYELFISVLWDEYVKSSYEYFDVSANALSFSFSFFEPTLYSIYHPEYIFYTKAENAAIASDFLTGFHFFFINNESSHVLTTPFFYAIQFFILVFSVLFFVTMFFSFFNTENSNEGATDSEFFMTNLTIEAEKEIFSADDAKYLIILVIIFFGSYFCFLALSSTPFEGIAVFFLGLAPVLFFAILSVPVSLLFDFGLFFLIYLRGTAATSSIMFELIYDYIGVTAFFTRIIVQFVRIGLMFAVYGMMHETVVLENISSSILPLNSDVFDDVSNGFASNNLTNNYYLTALLGQLLYWTYEVLHTFFVVTAQFAAFFAIAFWLFLLFYTFFVYEKHEHHFKNLRPARRAALKALSA